MNIPIELLELQKHLWNQLQDGAQREQIAGALISSIVHVVRGIAPPLLIGLLLFTAITFLYRPRIPRGGFWTPAFGLLGNAPKFYCHSRPSSFCGVFTGTRRRLAARSHRKRNNRVDKS
jgi:hypothetical protein